MADAPDLGSGSERIGGSSPLARTTSLKHRRNAVFMRGDDLGIRPFQICAFYACLVLAFPYRGAKDNHKVTNGFSVILRIVESDGFGRLQYMKTHLSVPVSIAEFIGCTGYIYSAPRWKTRSATAAR